MAQQRKMLKSWVFPDELWERMQQFLPKYVPSPKGGQPRANLRAIANGIFYVLRTGIQWKAVPREYGSGSTLHRYFQEWTELGVFHNLWRTVLSEYDELKKALAGIGKASTER